MVKNQLISVKLKVRTDCEIVLMTSSNQPIKIIDIRPISSDRVKHLVMVPHSFINKLALKEELLIKKHRSIGKSCIISIDKKSCTVCKILYNTNVFLSSAFSGEEGHIIYSFLTDKEGLNKLLKLLKKNKIEYSIVEITHIDVKSSILTSTQEKILFIALETGLFDYPRRITLKELAIKLGLSPSTLDEIIRRGLKKLLKAYFRRTRIFSGTQ